MRSEMCSLHLTHPSAHTPGAAGSRHCARGAVGGSVPCSRVSPQSWTLPAWARIRNHNLGLPRVSSPTLYPLGHDCPTRSFSYPIFFSLVPSVNTSSSQEISVYTRNHWNRLIVMQYSWRISMWRNSLVIMPQRYTKNREDDLEYVHKPCTLYTNSTQQEKLVNLVKLIGSVASAARTEACNSPLLLL